MFGSGGGDPLLAQPMKIDRETKIKDEFEPHLMQWDKNNIRFYLIIDLFLIYLLISSKNLFENEVRNEANISEIIRTKQTVSSV